MINRMFTATSRYARRKASQSAAWAVFARDTVSGFVTTAHHTLMLLGVTAIGVVGLLIVEPDLADHLKALSPFAVARTTAAAGTPTVAQETAAREPLPMLEEPPVEEPKKVAADTKQQRWVTDWLSKRYRVSTSAIDNLVGAAYATAREMKLDPLLILSVVAIESRFNPFAESPVGAQGLMQVMSKVHRDKFEGLGGLKAALDPVANIRVGSQILKEYVTRGGSVEAGLKMYVGAGARDTDYGYGAKVLAEYQRLQEVAKGKKVPVFTPPAAPAVKPKEQEAKFDSNTGTRPAARAAEHAGDQIAAL